MPYKDPQKQKEAQHRSYCKHKKKIKERHRNFKESNRKYVRQYKEQFKCAICGFDHPACKDLHHISGKDKKISRAVAEWGLERIKEELKKCIVVCVNCHRKLHANKLTTTSNARRIKNRKFISEYRKLHPCECGEDCEICLDFHHTGKKEEHITRAICDWGLDRLKEEVSRCKVLCANCHRMEHYDKTGCGEA